MKTSAILGLLTIFFLFTLSVQAAPGPDKAKAKAVLMKTHRAIGVARVTVMKTKKYTGNLAKAVRYQRYAKKLYLQNNFARAIHFSRKARFFALQVMKENGAKSNTDFVETAEEGTLAGTLPSDQELQEELDKNLPTSPTDQELLNGNLDTDVQ